MNCAQLDSPEVTELREWLNNWCRMYFGRPVTDDQLLAWISEAEESPDGLVEIPARHSVTGTPITFQLAVRS